MRMAMGMRRAAGGRRDADGRRITATARRMRTARCGRGHHGASRTRSAAARPCRSSRTRRRAPRPAARKPGRRHRAAHRAGDPVGDHRLHHRRRRCCSATSSATPSRCSSSNDVIGELAHEFHGAVAMALHGFTQPAVPACAGGRRHRVGVLPVEAVAREHRGPQRSAGCARSWSTSTTSTGSTRTSSPRASAPARPQPLARRRRSASSTARW